MRTVFLVGALLPILLILASASPIQAPPCEGEGWGWDVPGTHNGTFECPNTEDCRPGCEQTIVHVPGMLVITCFCDDGHAYEDCCRLVLVIEPGEWPYLDVLGDCAGLDPFSGCDVGFDCKPMEFEHDEDIVIEAACV